MRNFEMPRPYKAGVGSDGKDAVLGPGDGLGHASGTLWPDLRCRSKEEAIRAAAIANIAFHAGIASAQHNIQRALGLKVPTCGG